MTKASDLKNRVHKLIDDGGGREQYENDSKYEFFSQAIDFFFLFICSLFLFQVKPTMPHI